MPEGLHIERIEEIGRLCLYARYLKGSSDYGSIEALAKRQNKEPAEFLYTIFKEGNLIPDDPVHDEIARAVIDTQLTRRGDDTFNEVSRQLCFYNDKSKGEIEALLLAAMRGSHREVRQTAAPEAETVLQPIPTEAPQEQLLGQQAGIGKKDSANT